MIMIVITNDRKWTIKMGWTGAKNWPKTTVGKYIELAMPNESIKSMYKKSTSVTMPGDLFFRYVTMTNADGKIVNKLVMALTDSQIFSDGI